MSLYQNKISFLWIIHFFRLLVKPLVYIQYMVSSFLHLAQKCFFFCGYGDCNFLKSHLYLSCSPLLVRLSEDYYIQKPPFLQTKVYLLGRFFQQKTNLTYRFFYNLCIRSIKHNFQYNPFLHLLWVLYGQCEYPEKGLSCQYKNIYHRKWNTLLFAIEGHQLILCFVLLSLSSVLKRIFTKIQNISTSIRIFINFVSVTECRLHPIGSKADQWVLRSVI